jgi:hypothetical protein
MPPTPSYGNPSGSLRTQWTFVFGVHGPCLCRLNSSDIGETKLSKLLETNRVALVVGVRNISTLESLCGEFGAGQKKSEEFGGTVGYQLQYRQVRKEQTIANTQQTDSGPCKQKSQTTLIQSYM